jgi:heat shock protein HslJ
MARIGLLTLVAIPCAALLLACGDGVLGPGEIVTLDIHPSRVTCHGMGEMQCMQVREPPESSWTLLYQGIEGFNHEPGLFHTVRVRIVPVSNPPADGSSLRYILLRIIRRQPVTS